MRKIFAVAVVALLLAIAAAHPAMAADKTPDQLVKEAKAAIKEVSIGDVQKMIDAKETVILLDVTDKQEFEAGHLPGAMNISRGTLEFKSGLMLPDKKMRIVVYCGLDLRSPLATRTLNELGYANAVNMTGGMKAWKAAGYPAAP
jgi:rhodanese-related sulfurtransferase